MNCLRLITIVLLSGMHSILFPLSEKTLRTLSERRLRVELDKAEKKNDTTMQHLITGIGAERFGWQFGLGAGTGTGAGGAEPHAGVPKPTTPPAGAGEGEWVWMEKKEEQGAWRWVAEGETIGDVPGMPPGAPEGALPTPETAEPTPKPEKPVEEGVPAPPAPPLPKPTPKPPEQVDVKPVPRKEKTVVDFVNTPLSESELRALTPKQKRTSDGMVLEVIKEIANDFPIVGTGDIEETDFAGKKQKYTNGIDAYVTRITKIVVERLGTSPQFKKYAELLEVVSEKDKHGSIEGALVGYRKPLDQLYTLFGKPGREPVAQLLSAFSSLVFEVEEWAERATRLLRTIGINAGVTSRTIDTSVAAPAQVISDAAVLSQINEVLQAARKEVETFEHSKDGKALLDKAVGDVTDEQERSRLQKDAVVNHLAGNLSRDYIEELSGVLNRLRLERRFKKFVHLVGMPAQQHIPAKATGISRLSWEPVIDMIAKEEEPLNPSLFLAALKKQALFDGDDLDTIVTRTDVVYKTILDDHQVKVIKRMGTVDVAELLADRFETIKNVKGIINLIAFIKKAAGTRPGMQTIVSELEKREPDSDILIEAFKKLAETSALPYEQKLRSIIAEHVQENQVMIKAYDVLEAAVQQFAKTKASLGKWIADELQRQKVFEAVRSVAQRQRLAHDLKAVDRTPKTVKRIFIQLLGSVDNVKKLVKDTTWYEWIEPYGVLMMVLKVWPQELSGEIGLDAQLGKLTRTIQAMNDARLRGSAAQYVSPAVQEKDMLEAGLYKNKLQLLLDLFNKADYKAFVDGVTALVKEAQVGVEHTEEFESYITEFKKALVRLVSQGILKQVQQLNRGGEGTYLIEGLSLEGPQKGIIAQVYFALDGLFDNLITALQSFVSNPVAGDVASLQKAVEEVKKSLEDTLSDAQKSVALTPLHQYLERVLREMKGIKAIAVVAPEATKPATQIPIPGAVPPASAPGAAPPAAAPGSIPTAPPLIPKAPPLPR